MDLTLQFEDVKNVTTEEMTDFVKENVHPADLLDWAIEHYMLIGLNDENLQDQIDTALAALRDAKVAVEAVEDDE